MECKKHFWVQNGSSKYCLHCGIDAVDYEDEEDEEDDYETTCDFLFDDDDNEYCDFDDELDGFRIVKSLEEDTEG